MKVARGESMVTLRALVVTSPPSSSTPQSCAIELSFVVAPSGRWERR
jgi:hypothetical protein